MKRFSPTDLMRFFISPYESWATRYSSEVNSTIFIKDPENEFLSMAKKKGDDHEYKILKRYQDEKLSIKMIPDSGPREERLDATKQAMLDGLDIIYQGSLENEFFFGKTDFLVKTHGDSNLGNYRYEILDAKLARRAKAEHIIQLSCYRELLENIQGKVSDNASLIYGDGELERFNLDNYDSFYKALREKFFNFHASFNPDDIPDPASYDEWGIYSEYAKNIIQQTNNLSSIAGIRKSQIKKLKEANINSCEELINSEISKETKINPKVLDRLKLQAKHQLKSKKNSKLSFEVLPHSARGLGLKGLPEKSLNDIYFDLESNTFTIPMTLHYLWGFAHEKNSHKKFDCLWAHTQEDMKEVFESFVDMLMDKFSEDPKMHVFHYGAFEVTTLKTLAGYFSSKSDEIDHLLRNNVFIDLFKLVKQSFCIGSAGYGLKDIEPIFRNERTEEVTGGAESMIQYELWSANNDETKDETDSELLKNIWEYNREDCFSLIDLVDWMRSEQIKNGFAYENLYEEEKSSVVEFITQEINSKYSAKGKQPYLQLLLDLCLYHRREAKPSWWRYFDMLASEDDELEIELDCLANAIYTGKKFKEKKSMVYEYKFNNLQESKIKEADRVRIKSDPTINCEVFSMDLDAGKFELKSTSDLPNELSLILFKHVSAKIIENSIESITNRYYQKEYIKPCLKTFFDKKRPTLVNDSEQKNNLTKWGENILESSKKVISAMKDSTLCLQGPPGSGKTYVCARVIADLIKKGKKIGIASNSHKAINNVIEELILVMDDQKIDGNIAKVDRTSEEEKLYKNKRITIFKSIETVHLNENLAVVGGTAWAFSNQAIQDELDYLFVDEAGQVSVANLVGMSQSTSNIVLIGDQMQLAQPSQGIHPGDSGTSCLSYFLGDKPTIPNDIGILLSGTHRLHPNICEFISREVYEGRLVSEGDAPLRKLKLPKDHNLISKESGIMHIPASHVANSQASIEEIEIISNLIEELLICEKFDPKKNSFTKLSKKDILVVAPYNHQVRSLKGKFNSQIEVGTVDKFQGREAEVVIVSMTSSDIFEAPRGVEFLMEKNRLNVAITRAKTLAIIVGSEGLHQPVSKTVRDMELQNFYISLINYASKS